MNEMKKCTSLDEVREEIDKLDIKLVDLIAQRSHLIRQAAAFKNSIDEVKAEDRINFIMQRIRHHAIEKEVSPNMISELFTIIETVENFKIRRGGTSSYYL